MLPKRNPMERTSRAMRSLGRTSGGFRRVDYANGAARPKPGAQPMFQRVFPENYRGPPGDEQRLEAWNSRWSLWRSLPESAWPLTVQLRSFAKPVRPSEWCSRAGRPSNRILLPLEPGMRNIRRNGWALVPASGRSAATSMHQSGGLHKIRGDAISGTGGTPSPILALCLQNIERTGFIVRY